jgi:hypothetical protein
VSCSSPPVNVPVVQAAIDDAFHMAGEAWLAVDDVIKNSAEKKDNIKDFAGWIFVANWAEAQGESIFRFVRHFTDSTNSSLSRWCLWRPETTHCEDS